MNVPTTEQSIHPNADFYEIRLTARRNAGSHVYKNNHVCGSRGGVSNIYHLTRAEQEQPLITDTNSRVEGKMSDYTLLTIYQHIHDFLLSCRVKDTAYVISN